MSNKSVKIENGDIYSADIIINTIPWREFKEMKGMLQNIRESISKLKYSSIET